MSRDISDHDFGDNELVNARFVEVTTLPEDPSFGEVVTLTIGNAGYIVYWNGQKWVSTRPLDSDMTNISTLTPANDDFLQRKANIWTNRTIPQVKTDLKIPTDTVTSLATEVTNRTNADSTLTTNLATETTNRTAADTTLTTNLAAEVTNRTSAITAETNARVAADTALQPLDSDLTAIAAITHANDDFVQAKAGSWTNRTVAQVKADLNLVTDTSAQLTTLTTADTTESTARTNADNLRVLKAGDVMTGNLSVPTTSMGGAFGELTFYSSFTAGTANQKMDLYFTTPAGVTLNGFFDIWVLGAGAIPGVVAKRYAVGLSGSTASYNFARYTEEMGMTSPHIALSDLTRDVTNNRWKVQVQHRDTTAVSFALVVQLYSADAASDVTALIPLFGLGAVYTTDTAVPIEPVVWIENLFIAQGSTSNFVVPSGGTYTLTSNDSVILAPSGSTATLPAASSVAIGRTYIIKNIGTSGVTVTSAGGLIDGSANMAIGNRAYATFMSDSVDWWRVS